MKKLSLFLLAVLCTTTVCGTINSVAAVQDSTDPLQVATIPAAAATVDINTMPEYVAANTGMRFRLSTPICNTYNPMNAVADKGVLQDQFKHVHYLERFGMEKTADVFELGACGITDCNEKYSISVESRDINQLKANYEAANGVTLTYDEFMAIKLSDYIAGKVDADEYGNQKYWNLFNVNGRDWYTLVTMDPTEIYNDVYCEVFTLVGDRFVGAVIGLYDEPQIGNMWLQKSVDAHDNVELMRKMVTEFSATAVFNQFIPIKSVNDEQQKFRNSV